MPVLVWTEETGPGWAAVCRSARQKVLAIDAAVVLTLVVSKPRQTAGTCGLRTALLHVHVCMHLVTV